MTPSPPSATAPVPELPVSELPVPQLPVSELPVVETFHSLQGEGLHAGRSAFFIRLAGCTVGCSWCDTKHSWPQAVHPRLGLAELAEQALEAAAAGAAFAVVSGGEPLHHDLGPLCAQLRRRALERGRPPLPLHLETSGVDPLSGRFDWITLSPKRHRPPRPELLAACHELKVVVHEPADLAFAEAMAAAALAARRAIGPEGAGATPAVEAPAVAAPADPLAAAGPAPAAPALLLQPGHGSPQGQALAIGHIQAHPAWRLSLQTHKLLGVR